ncbi:MAG: beta-galactosidase [Polyangia bacterium]
MLGRPRIGQLCLVVTLLAGCVRRPSAPTAHASTAGPLTVVPIGLCEDYPEESRSMAEVRRDMALMASAGVRTLRVSVGWDGVEPARGQYDLAFWDSFFAEMAAAGIRVIPYVAYTPRWASSGTGDDFWRYPPANVQAFAATMGMLVRRYHGTVGSWELWNEPDNRDYWRGTVAQFADLLVAGARAVRAADPTAKVVFGGIAGHPAFAAEVMARPELAGLIDVVNAHAYFETWNPDSLETLPRYLAAFDPVLRNGAPVLRNGGRSLWLAEVGYSNYRAEGAVSADVQARFAYEHTLPFQAVALVRTLALALSLPQVSLVAWYELKDPRAGAPMIGDDNNRHLGVAFSDWRPKPALAALALIERLFGRGFRRADGLLHTQREPGSRAEVHAFVTAQGRVAIVAWVPTAAQSVEHVSVNLAGLTAAGPASWWDAEGHARPAPSGAVVVPGQEPKLDGLELRGDDVVVVEIPLGS